MASLDGKVAFITGAARGQGRAEAVRLASDGANIIAVDICDQIASVPYPMATPDDLAQTVKLVEDTGARIVAREADVRDRDGAEHRAAGTASTSSAGWTSSSPTPASLRWRRETRPGATSSTSTSPAPSTPFEVAIPTMIEQGDGGSIVLISSVAGLVPMGSSDPGGLGYTAAKHGMVGLMRQYANVLAEHSIRVNTVHPTGVNTPMIDNDYIRSWLQRTGGGSGGNAMPVPAVEAEDIANAVAWLVSDAARYVTGVTLPVDAGAVVKH